MNTSSRLNGIGEYYFSQKLREIAKLNAEGRNIINLGIGSPDLPPPPDVIKVLHEESAKPNVHGYQGYKGVPELRNAFASWYSKWYNVSLDPETEILPLIGSKEGIMHICMTYLNHGDLALVPDPGYPTYSSAVKLAGGDCITYELKQENNWQPDFTAIQNKLSGKVKLMFVNYPHMPTGQLPDLQLFENIIALGKKHNILIVHDNPYSFILNDKPMSILSVDGAKEVAVELNSLSKSHNMAGWRVGVLCGAKEKIDDVLRFKSNMDSGMFLPLQLAAAKALQLDNEWHNQLNKTYSARKKLVTDLLEVINCKIAPEQAGLFVWASIPSSYKDCYELSDEILYGTNVFITPGGIFGKAGERYVRVSLCCTEEKLKLATGRVQKIKA
ncbi:MAG TPA: aminotransferase class I/II-fold pyridoxal phosphate-dependent enzyme [Flavitalea sp.]|nr:aminotransferase class I/II-fold pyridoxal phosphate-dependent enzyme [Flavitalea sp.]